jgi:hypothetical protein
MSRSASRGGEVIFVTETCNDETRDARRETIEWERRMQTAAISWVVNSAGSYLVSPCADAVE